MKSDAAQVLERLQRISAAGGLDTPQRLARLVARVLVSRRLKQRRKWCQVARTVAVDPCVEVRLVRQAMRWLSIQPGSTYFPSTSKLLAKPPSFSHHGLATRQMHHSR